MFVWGNGGYVGAVWVWCAWCVCAIWHTFVKVCVLLCIYACVRMHALRSSTFTLAWLCTNIKFCVIHECTSCIAIHTSMHMYKHATFCANS